LPSHLWDGIIKMNMALAKKDDIILKAISLHHQPIG
jgi:hypothetical protein